VGNDRLFSISVPGDLQKSLKINSDKQEM